LRMGKRHMELEVRVACPNALLRQPDNRAIIVIQRLTFRQVFDALGNGGGIVQTQLIQPSLQVNEGARRFRFFRC